MAIMEITVVPLGTSSPSVSRYVAGAVRVLREAKDVRYELTPMGTVVEGETDRLLELAAQMHRTPFAAGAVRVVTTVKIDERRDKPVTMSGKVAAVREKLGK